MATMRWSLRLPRASVTFRRPTNLRTLTHDLKQTKQIRQQNLRTATPSGIRGLRTRREVPRDRPDREPNALPNHTNQPSEQAQEQDAGRNTQLARTLAESDSSDLVTDVHIPLDPHCILSPGHPALAILENSSLVIQRQLEMMNVMLGFEQANKYVIMDGQGQTVGYIAEQDHGIGSAMKRQFFRTHRSFTTHIFDRDEREVLRIHRPFAYINSRIRIYDPVPEGGYQDTVTSAALQGTSTSSAINPNASAHVSPLKLEEMRIIGEAQQQWAPLRRKYNLFSFRPLEASPENLPNNLSIESGDKPTSDTKALTEAKIPDEAIESGMQQFAHINEPFLSWDFTLKDEQTNTVGSVNRNFGGFAREIFTDTGVYALRMDSAADQSNEVKGMTLDQRAIMLATAVSIDFDYFSRHSHSGGGWMPLWIPWGGGAAEGGAVGAGTAGAAGEAGAVVGAGEVGAGATGTAARGVGGIGAAEGIAGAGTMAGYEAMQRGVYGQSSGQSQPDPQSPQAPQTTRDGEPMFNPEQQSSDPGEDFWGRDPWNSEGTEGHDDRFGGQGGDNTSGGGGGEGGGSWLDSFFEE